MAFCLTAPSHYLNQCWLIISNVPWHSSQGSITRQCEDTINKTRLKIAVLKWHPGLPGANEVRVIVVLWQCSHIIYMLKNTIYISGEYICRYLLHHKLYKLASQTSLFVTALKFQCKHWLACTLMFLRFPSIEICSPCFVGKFNNMVILCLYFSSKLESAIWAICQCQIWESWKQES